MKIKSKLLTFLLIMAFAFVAVGSMALLTGCDDGTKGNVAEAPGKHVVDPNGMGGEGILDDGGAINPGEPQYVATGVNAEGEHQIVLGQDDEYYEFFGTELAAWSNSGYTVNRVRANSPDVYTIFTLDISELEDVSKVGVMLTLINTRPNTCISVSTDKASWTDIGWESPDLKVEADYSEHIDDLRGKTVSDKNLYQCYYLLGDYAVKGQPLYIKCGYSNEYYSGTTEEGTDVIDYISWFETFEFVYEWI